jgi:hypothetical protein
MVTIKNQDGTATDITSKREMEKAIITCNKKKFQLSFNTPFYSAPYNKLFGYNGLTQSSERVLKGTFIPPDNESPHMIDFLHHLVMPQVIKDNPTKMELTVDSFTSFWKKAKENTSCYPSKLSFTTMKASSHDSYLAQIDCILTRIPLNTGYSPMR